MRPGMAAASARSGGKRSVLASNNTGSNPGTFPVFAAGPANKDRSRHTTIGRREVYRMGRHAADRTAPGPPDPDHRGGAFDRVVEPHRAALHAYVLRHA